MIGIQLEGDEEFLETMPDTTINIRLENPLFGDDEDKLSPGSYSLPFDLPGGDNSPKNAQKLKNPDVIENNEAYQLQKATLYFGGVPFKSGNLRSKGGNKKRISAYFTFGLNSLSSSFKTAKLRDILNQNIVISSAARTKGVYIKKLNGSSTASINVSGQVYSDTTLSGIGVLINDYYDDNMIVDGDVWLPRSELIASGDTPLGMTPPYIHVRMAHTITSIITGLPTIEYSNDPHIPFYIKLEEDQKLNWQVEAFDMTDYYQDFKDFLDGYLTGLYPNDLIRWPLLYNANLHPEGFKDTIVINGVRAAGLRVNNPNAGIPINVPLYVRNENSLQPFLLLKSILDKIADHFGFEYEGDFYDDPDTATRLFDHSYTLDLPMEFLGEKKFIFWRRSFNVNELIPDITVVDFFKKLKGRYNLAVYYNDVSKKVRLKYREAIAKSNVYEDITEISSPVSNIDDIRSTGFTLKVPKEDSDAFSTDEVITSGTPEDDFEIEIGRLFQTFTELIDGKHLSGPYKSQPHGEEAMLRVFHYNGIETSGTYDHPAASLHGVISEALAISGLYQNRWLYWLRFGLNRLKIDVSVKFPLRKVLQFDYELKRRYDRSNFLIKAMDISLTNKGMKVTGVELYTMK